MTRLRRFAYVLLLSSTTLMPAAGQAQQRGTAVLPGGADNADPSSGLGDIIVTAQRRSERAQDVPIAINVVSGAMLARTGAVSTSDLALVAPGFNPRTSPGGFAPSIRGIGSLDATINAENAVPVYVDGVYYASAAASVFSLSNVERVEVLKGPQGTLFGRNAAGGLLSITTRTPSQDLEVDASASYANYNTVQVKGYLTAGLSKTLAFDFAGEYQHQADGWGVNTVTGRKVYFGEEAAFRSKLLFTPTEQTKITLEGDYSSRNYDTQSTLRVQSYGPDWFNLAQDVTPHSLTTYGGGSLTIDQELGFAKLLSITAYHQGVQNFTIDSDGLPAPIAVVIAHGVDRNVTEELQLQSLPSSKLNWIVGGFYMFRRSGYDPLTVGSPFLFAPFTALNDNAIQRLDSYSVFAQATYPVFTGTNITIGGRYTSDHVSLVAPRSFTTASGGNLVVSNGTGQQTFNRFTYRISADHHLSSQALVYASYNTGFKGGQYNLGAPGGLTFFARPQTIDAYEAGIKSEWFGKKLRLNFSAFHYDEKDVQVIFITTGIQQYVNAGSAKITGVDFEGVLAPIKSLDLRVGASLLPKADYGRFGPCPNPGGISDANLVNCNGQRVIQAPKLDLTASANYRADLAAAGTLDFNVAAQHTSSFHWDAFYRYFNGAVPSPKSVDAIQPAYDLLNASITWQNTGGRYAISVWGKNLTDQQYAIFGQGTSANNNLAKNPAYQDIPGAPRTYGVTVTGKF